MLFLLLSCCSGCCLFIIGLLSLYYIVSLLFVSAHVFLITCRLFFGYTLGIAFGNFL